MKGSTPADEGHVQGIGVAGRSLSENVQGFDEFHISLAITKSLTDVGCAPLSIKKSDGEGHFPVFLNGFSRFGFLARRKKSLLGITGPSLFCDILGSHPSILRPLQLPVEVRELHWQLGTTKNRIMPEDAETSPAVLSRSGKDSL